MKKTGFFLIVLLLSMNLFAKEFELIEFRILHKDFKAEMSPVMDIDGQFCAALRVESEVPTDLSLDQKIYKKEEIKSGEYYFFISYKEKNITFKAPNYKTLAVPVPDNGLIMGKVYYVRLKSKEDAVEPPKVQQVLIASNPDGAKLLINGEDKGFTSKGLALLPGFYEFYLNKQGYAALKQTIEVKARQENIFNFTLIELPKENLPVPDQAKPQDQAPPSSGMVVTMNGYRVELNSIVRQNDASLLCKLTVTRIDDDSELHIYREWGEKSTRLFDNNGAEYVPSMIKAANKSGDGGYLAHRFVRNISTPVLLLVKNVDKTATTITLLEFSIWDASFKNFKISFRNFTVQ